MNYAALRDLILAQPDGSPCRVAYAAGNDTACAAALNAATEPGMVPRRHVCVTFARHPAEYALARWVTRFATMPAPYGGGAAPFALYALFLSVLLVVDSDVEPPLEATMADVTGGFAQVPAGLISDGFMSDFLAGEIKLGKSAVALRRTVTYAEVESARKGNN